MFSTSVFGRETISMSLAMKNFKIERRTKEAGQQNLNPQMFTLRKCRLFVFFETSHASIADLPNSFEVSHRG